ncbi:hypothetical protein Q9L42_002745 [Methylomarinum sp. Ch1-1]|uniref:Uncharacterized protein n=1 Tax=Methylomarinum roseum TaxID=3067653 RepID=A0AAU7NVR7_9GAMM|nr:hypothetical protein [Methylomarinum sp. Ch1-1]MDP4522913.1 hypothetical protein [Methylomarinum sp. Ch1-1]
MDKPPDHLLSQLEQDLTPHNGNRPTRAKKGDRKKGTDLFSMFFSFFSRPSPPPVLDPLSNDLFNLIAKMISAGKLPSLNVSIHTP